MDLTINLGDNLENNSGNKIKINPIIFQKMNLIYNALEEG